MAYLMAAAMAHVGAGVFNEGERRQAAGDDGNTGGDDDEDKGRQRQQWEEDFDDEPGLGESGITLKRLVAGGAGNKPRVWHCNIVFNLILNVDHYMFNIISLSNDNIYFLTSTSASTVV
jgi:hypothetical protein